jgi:hypothetical protein
MIARPISTAASPTGRFRKKIPGQLASWTISAPSGGPATQPALLSAGDAAHRFIDLLQRFVFRQVARRTTRQ